MSEPTRRVLASTSGVAPGACIRFMIVLEGVETPAFAVSTPSGWRAYVDRCRHLPLTLDAGGGELSMDGGRTLVCMRHDANYDAANGACLSGACEDRALTALALELRGGELWCTGRPGARG